MRTREMSYTDYGITEEEKQYIKQFCENADEENARLIKQALSELNPYISPYIYTSLTQGISYDKLIVKNEIYISKEDFYGYRRKGMDAIKRWMIWSGLWER